MARLANKVAVITGGAGGIGTAICQRFVDEGATVYGFDVQQAQNGSWPSFVVDITDENAIKDGFKSVDRISNRVDILINAAGIEIEKTIEDTSLDEWNRIFAINVTGTYLMSKHCLPLLRRSKAASIINFGSYDGFIADPKLAAYCATKGAVHALTKAMACDHGPEGIRVNAICPGMVNTPMMESFVGGSESLQSLQSKLADLHPSKTMGEPEDIANLALWLASDEARYASGQLWIIDGGLTAQVQQMKL